MKEKIISKNENQSLFYLLFSHIKNKRKIKVKEMVIRVNSKDYEKYNLRLVDSISRFEWQEYIYYTENLYISEDGAYILETMWQLSPEWHKDSIESGMLSEKDLEKKVEYRLMSFEEADAWLDDSIWEV